MTTIAFHIFAKGFTQYTQFPFNSVATFGGVHLAANDDGIFALGGDSDGGDEIPAWFILRTTDMGTSAQKRLRSLEIGGETDGSMQVSVTTGTNTRSYNASPASAQDLEQRGFRVPVGRDGKGRYWSVKLANVAGSDFSIDSMSATFAVLGVRTGGRG